MNNIYYNPEKFGLEVLGTVEWSDGCYQFDTSVVWRDKETGKIYVADDSGCSCPCPFDNYGRDDLRPINRTQDLIDYFDERKSESFRYDPDDEYSDSQRIDGEIGELILKARAA